ncbi:MAG: ComF family protein [Halioglobus sp.]
MARLASSRWARHWIQHFGKMLFPFDCSLCGLACERDRPLCDDCEASLKPNAFPCASCGLPLIQTDASVSPTDCGRCLSNPTPFDAVVAPWLYDLQMAHLIGQWKYHGNHWLTPLLADLWLEQQQLSVDCHGDNFSVDVIVPVPLTPLRLLHRGFNQSRLLSTEIHRRLPTNHKPSLDYTLLSRTRQNGTQASLGAQARRANIDHVFTVHRPCDNLRIAVVDDVVTTTATASEIAKQLKRYGAARVEIWCIARTPLPEYSYK